MTSFLDPLIAFVSAHPWLAYLTLFLAALLEAVPVVGALVPGSTIILALSALVPGGELQLWGVLAAAIAGAMLGDGSAYLGRPSRATRNPRRLADVGISRRDGAERGVLPSLGRAGGVFCALRAADPRLRAGHGGRAGDAAAAFYGVNIPAVLAWALAHVLPGVLAVSALHHYAGLPHHEHIGKHLWMLARIRRRSIVALGVWTLRRRQSPDQAAGLRPGAGPT